MYVAQMEMGCVIGEVPPIHPHLVLIDIVGPQHVPSGSFKPDSHEAYSGEELRDCPRAFHLRAFRNRLTVDAFVTESSQILTTFQPSSFRIRFTLRSRATFRASFASQ
jgi:hypothetical protein